MPGGSVTVTAAAPCSSRRATGAASSALPCLIRNTCAQAADSCDTLVGWSDPISARIGPGRGGGGGSTLSVNAPARPPDPHQRIRPSRHRAASTTANRSASVSASHKLTPVTASSPARHGITGTPNPRKFLHQIHVAIPPPLGDPRHLPPASHHPPLKRKCRRDNAVIEQPQTGADLGGRTTPQQAIHLFERDV